MGAVPYAPSEHYRNPYVGTLADLAMRNSAMQADARRREGEIAAQKWQGAGQAIAGTLGALAKEREEAPIRKQEAEMRDLTLQNARDERDARTADKQRDAQFLQFLQSGQKPTPDVVMGLYGPERGARMLGALNAFEELHSKQIADQRDTTRRLVQGFMEFSPELQKEFWPDIREAAIGAGMGTEQQIPTEPKPDFLRGLLRWAGGEPAKPDLMPVNPGDVVIDKGNPGAGPVYTAPPKPVDAPKPPTVGSFEDYVTRKYGANPTPEQITEARKVYQQADDRPININTGVNANIPGNFDVTGEKFLDSIPRPWRSTVKKIAHYEEDPTKVASMRGGMRETLMTWVNQVNPAYDQSVFANRSPTRKAFTTGAQGQQINAINTAIGHINQITGVATELQNGGFTPANKAWNSVRTAFGSDKVTNFDTLKDALAGEVASVLSKGGATVSGIAEAKEKINAANSPTQLAGYVKTLIPIMGSKLAELNFQYHQAMGADDPFSALSPESREILLSLGFDPDKPQIGQGVTSQTAAGSAATPNGKAPTKTKIGRFEVEVH